MKCTGYTGDIIIWQFYSIAAATTATTTSYVLAILWRKAVYQVSHIKDNYLLHKYKLMTEIE